MYTETFPNSSEFVKTVIAECMPEILNFVRHTLDLPEGCTPTFGHFNNQLTYSSSRIISTVEEGADIIYTVLTCDMNLVDVSLITWHLPTDANAKEEWFIRDEKYYINLPLKAPLPVGYLEIISNKVLPNNLWSGEFVEANLVVRMCDESSHCNAIRIPIRIFRNRIMLQLDRADIVPFSEASSTLKHQ